MQVYEVYTNFTLVSNKVKAESQPSVITVSVPPQGGDNFHCHILKRGHQRKKTIPGRT